MKANLNVRTMQASGVGLIEVHYRMGSEGGAGGEGGASAPTTHPNLSRPYLIHQERSS
ncbi:MAG: hypothetical protein ACRDIV_12660 [Ktedonobacteraceae bacterium]